MPRICYDEAIKARLQNNPAHMKLVKTANAIVRDMAAQGFDLTLRQLYYQFVAHHGLPNKDTEYKRLGGIINDARYAGLIDWKAITDRTRYLRSVNHWDEPSDIIEACADQYRIDKWADQSHRVEVWIEKDALIGVIGNVCTELDLGHFSCRGYTSASELWEAAQRLKRYADAGQTPIVLHFGDHDPSGIDMTRDIEARLSLFAETPIEVRRLALTMEQIDEYDPPPNPAKLTDSRCTGYMAKYGSESWELDALEPSVIVTLIRDEVATLRDDDAWARMTDSEDDQRTQLKRVSEKWDDVIENL